MEILRARYVVRLAAAVAAVLTASGRIAAAAPESVFGVTQSGFLINWNSDAPGTILSGVPVQGLLANETLVGIDFRPATKELYGLGSFSRLYRINPATGQSSLVGAGFSSVTLNGGSFGMDFNPTVDRVRIVSDADQNLRAHPVTGDVVSSDPALFYAAGDVNFGVNPNVVSVAYANNRAGAMSTTLYGLDAGTDSLVVHEVGPGFAQLRTIGSMGTDVTEIGGFDISGATDIPYAVIRDAQLARSTFWTINLMTGQGMMVGEIGGGHLVTAMAVAPEPATLALLAAGLFARRRR